MEIKPVSARGGARQVWRWSRYVLLCVAFITLSHRDATAQPQSGSQNSNTLPAEQLEGVLVRDLRPSMGTLVEISIWHPDQAAAQSAVDAAYGEIHRLERRLSEWLDTSDISIINNNAAAGPVSVGDDTLVVLKAAIRVGDASGGAFDVTWATLSQLWDFSAVEPRVPTPSEIAEKLPMIDYRNVTLDLERKTVFFQKPGIRLGLGGIAKGYAVDRAANLLYSSGFSSFMINAGGDINARGRHGDQPWKIGLQHPRKKRGEVFAYVFLTADTLVTSSDYERWFVQDGKRYHHIIDPKTGFPTTKTASVTVVGQNGTLADAAATAAMVLGPEKGSKMLAKLGLDGVFVKENGHIVVTPGLKKRLILVDKGPLDMTGKVPAKTP
ncbi:MAG: FAD:protein FMN transferase [Myxococcales bacterium]|nr:FAD:protein FMN transferase [Myxococcales bacterium]